MEDAELRTSDGANATEGAPWFALVAALLAVAVVSAATAGVLETVGPYLLGVSVLVGVLFVLGRR